MPYNNEYNYDIAKQYNQANENYINHLIKTHQQSKMLSNVISAPDTMRYKDAEPSSYFDEDHRLKGSGFFDDLGEGLDTVGNVVGKVADVAQKVAPLAELAAGSKKSKKKSAKKSKKQVKGSEQFLQGDGFLDDVLQTATKIAPLAMLAAGKKSKVGRPSKMKGGVGMGVSANKKLDNTQAMLALGAGKKKTMHGDGFWDDLGEGLDTVGNVVGKVADVAGKVAPLAELAAGSKKKKLVEQSQMKGVVVGGKKKQSKWQELVSKISKKRGKGLKDAIQFIKENNLYEK